MHWIPNHHLHHIPCSVHPTQNPVSLSSGPEGPKHMAWMLPCWAVIGDQDVRGKKMERRLAHFYSLITFTGPQSHLRNHGDADKVTHDYSSMAVPDWTAPESLAKHIHQLSLCPCSTSICPSGWWGSISAALRLFFTLTSCLNLTLHLSSLLLSLITCPLLMSHPFLSHLSLFFIPVSLLSS